VVFCCLRFAALKALGPIWKLFPLRLKFFSTLSQKRQDFRGGGGNVTEPKCVLMYIGPCIIMITEE